VFLTSPLVTMSSDAVVLRDDKSRNGVLGTFSFRVDVDNFESDNEPSKLSWAPAAVAIHSLS